jgi:hypothetical protein
MTSEAEDIPPAPHLATVAQGISVNGGKWTVEAGGTREACWTFMDIELPDGRQVGGGGLGGPALPADQLVNLSLHQSGTEVRYIVGRVHPTVKRLHLEFADNPASGLDLAPVGESSDLGVAFIAYVLPPANPIQSGSIADCPAGDVRSGWRPF